jgi:predicted HTH domain antitoxin
MPLTISDETLQATGLSEPEARLEIACRWFDEGRLSFSHAAHFAHLDKPEFEAQLEQRGIPRFRYTEEMLDRDIQALRKFERE